jgi:hypothetical protein
MRIRHYERRLLSTLLLLLFFAECPSPWRCTAYGSSTAAGTQNSLLAGGKPILAGVNVLLENQGPPYQSFDMFDTRHFDVAALNADFATIKAQKYDFVRLWLKGYDPDEGFGLTEPGVSDAYAANVLRALQLARANGVRVVLTGAFRQGLWLPQNYIPAGLPPESVVGGENRLLLLPPMAQAAATFYVDLLRKLQADDPGILSTLLYFDLYNELGFDLAQPPFTASTGTYVFAGQTYDLGRAKSRQALMDASATAWMRTVSDAVHGVDSSLPVTASSFLLAAFGHAGFDGGLPTGAREHWAPYPTRPAALIAGGAGLIDIHIYSSPAHRANTDFAQSALATLAKNEITPALARRVPVVFGEFGSSDVQILHPETSIPEMRATWTALCSLHPSGYALWWMNAATPQLPTNTRALLSNFGSATPACAPDT